MSLTPLMKQYNAIKEQHPNTMLLYRMGDFYELFNEDAKEAAKILGITLTSRNHGGKDATPLAGFPYHALDRYSSKLIKSGKKIAICEQIEDPKLATGIVKRGVVEVITAGTSLDPNFLSENTNNYLAAICNDKNDNFGFSAIDLSTGEFVTSEYNRQTVMDEIVRMSPAEILIPEDLFKDKIVDTLQQEIKTVITPYNNRHFLYEYAKQELTSHFNVSTLEGFGLKDLTLSVCTSGAIITYAKQQKKTELKHIQKITIQTKTDYMQLDASSIRNLELLYSAEGDNKATLLSAIDSTNTSMGARLLRRFILQPLVKIQAIEERLNAVEALLNSSYERKEITSILKKICDIERITGRIGTERANARDIINLKDSINLFPKLKKQIELINNPLLNTISNEFNGFEELTELIEKALLNEPPISIREGGLIKPGFDEEIDKLKNGSKEGREFIAQLQPKERNRTGINTLKVGYNKVFGYYIEVTKSNSNQVPDNYIRKQTLVNAERYITEELKNWEAVVLGADEKIKEREYQIFLEIRRKVFKWNNKLQSVAFKIALLDVLASFATVAQLNRYIKPIITENDKIAIEEGRHPVIEKLNPTEPFIPNDLSMNGKHSQILLITGPNMAGKSTYLRQTALIVLLAQIGSFVPAKAASIGVVDRIFTRVGASDKLSKGQSTFLVEMIEVANILRNATDKSLIILDEVGRGTSTFDGLSIAWAVTEHLHNSIKAKTLFATHYHELAELSGILTRVKNYNVQVNEWGDKIVFMRKIIEGSCAHSYGIEVARLAGVPSNVINRAKEILKNLESMEMTPDNKPTIATNTNKQQLTFFTPPPVQESNPKIIEKLKTTDINNITPLEAMKELSELINMVKNEN